MTDPARLREADALLSNPTAFGLARPDPVRRGWGEWIAGVGFVVLLAVLVLAA